MPPQEPNYAHLSESALAELREHTKQAVREGIIEGIKAAINDDSIVEAYWSQGLKVAKKQATQQAGSILVDGLGAFFKRAFQFAILGMLVYAVGGWTALAGLFKLLFGGDPK